MLSNRLREKENCNVVGAFVTGLLEGGEIEVRRVVSGKQGSKWLVRVASTMVQVFTVQ